MEVVFNSNDELSLLAAFAVNMILRSSKVSGWGVYCCDFLLLPITSGCS